MNAAELQALIRSRIPVADFMQLEVLSLTPDQVDISAPLEPNRNVHGTLFGGSGTAIALVAAWSLVHARMHAQGLLQPLVVAQQSTQYFKPVTDRVLARCRWRFSSTKAKPRPGWKRCSRRERRPRGGRSGHQKLTLPSGLRGHPHLTAPLVPLAVELQEIHLVDLHL